MQKADPAALRPLDGWVTAIILACCVIWGINQTAIKIANAGIPPFQQAGLRSLFAGLLVFAWCMFRGIALFERDGSLKAGIVIGLSFAANFMMVYPGLQLTSASRAVLFIYSMPFFVAIGAHYLIPGDRITPTKLAGLIAAFAGLAVALGDGLFSTSQPQGALLGDLLCLGSAIGWAVATLMMRTTSLRYIRPEKTLFYQLAISAPLLLLVSFVSGEGPASFDDPRVVLGFAYTVVIVAFITYVIWVWLLSRHPASVVASFTFLSPVFGVLAGALLLDERITMRTWLSLAFVVTGIILINKPTAARSPKP